MSGDGTPPSLGLQLQYNLQTPNSVARPQGVLRSRFRGNLGGFEPARPICATVSSIRVARPASPPLGQFLLHPRKRRLDVHNLFGRVYILGQAVKQISDRLHQERSRALFSIRSAQSFHRRGRFAFRLDGLARRRPFGVLLIVAQTGHSRWR